MKEILSKIYKETSDEFYKLLKHDLRLERKRFIVTANPEIIIYSEKDSFLYNLLLDQETCIVPDGISVVKVCQKLGFAIQERITGVDIASFLIKEGYNQKKTFFLFGSQEKTISTLVKKLELEYPDIDIIGYSNGYAEDKDDVFKNIVELEPDICLVALGVPQQELLIYKYINNFQKGIFVGVGGTFDVISGMKKRAPKLFVKLNLEWLYRIMKEPYRLKRFWKYNIRFMIKSRSFR